MIAGWVECPHGIMRCVKMLSFGSVGSARPRVVQSLRDISGFRKTTLMIRSWDELVAISILIPTGLAEKKNATLAKQIFLGVSPGRDHN
jgi:hypothetical protein